MAVLLAVKQKQLECIPIGFDRVGADVALTREKNG
jgi:hypothetical protein